MIGGSIFCFFFYSAENTGDTKQSNNNNNNKHQQQQQQNTANRAYRQTCMLTFGEYSYLTWIPSSFSYSMDLNIWVFRYVVERFVVPTPHEIRLVLILPCYTIPFIHDDGTKCKHL